jgi:fermentation-respiration switch protein FrsA (DUF1100 family)
MSRPPFDLRSALRASWDARWELALPAIPLVLILGGFVLPVPAAALTAAYALFVELIIHRDAQLRRRIVPLLVECGVLVGGVLLILGTAMGFTNYLITEHVPDDIAVLIGSSMGGYLAALYAARRPEIQRLLLMAPAFGFARRWPESMQPDTVAAWRRTGWLDVYHYGDQRPRRLSSSLLDDAAAYEDLPAFTQQALIFHGTRDTVVPPGYSEQFVSLHPNARLELLESDHQLLDVFDTIWDRSRTFLFG